ncbi:L-threonylcarbamoyladenylate synthase [Sphingomicrobium clamense]|uniref:Threonylcarbamoyl-AMP synthase n=1 Tax=Sphingomicrobium clamense TaxID=2851013 RepID=A0ABS6V6Z7_9SPHN|nr:L-threonylcarbamoyladenylate synthase [Sphingomicrobium sp. B8]MBW0145339.1 threonylcarbamoyl-AMP synthase [Sphingomicrobium sp. B8]
MSLQTEVVPANDAGINRAAEIILEGMPVAVPTETVYGLAADATDAKAVARIYAAKGRPSFNPLIVHVASLEEAQRLGVFSDKAMALAEAHWPGPLTLVLPHRGESGIAGLVTAGLDTLAIRCPAHPVMRQLIETVGKPLAAPSANASGRISPTSPAHVLASLDERIPLILDGGPCERGIESTIVAVDGDEVRLLRRGPIEVAADEADDGKVEAPGMLANHYAPSKKIRLDATYPAPDEILIGYGDVEGELTLGEDPVTAAARLFAALHEADASPHPRIAVAPIPGDGLAAAIRDRLQRAAAPRD